MFLPPVGEGIPDVSPPGLFCDTLEIYLIFRKELKKRKCFGINNKRNLSNLDLLILFGEVWKVLFLFIWSTSASRESS